MAITSSLMGRTPSPSRPPAFPSEILGPAWSNGAGWASPKYYTTVRYLAAAPASPPLPAPDSSAGLPDAGAPGGGGDEPPGGSEPGGGCSFAGASSASGGALALTLLGLLALRRKKSPERRNARGL